MEETMINELSSFGLKKAVLHLVRQALEDVDAMHGEKAYHNLRHTMDVMQWVNTFAIFNALDENERGLVMLVAAFHDYVHGSDQDEALSVNTMVQCMKESGLFDQDTIIRAGRILLGTTIRCENGRLVQQAFYSDDLLTRILADADLWALGSDISNLEEATFRLLEERFSGAMTDGFEMYELLGTTLNLLRNETLTAAGRKLTPERANNFELISGWRIELAQRLHVDE